MNIKTLLNPPVNQKRKAAIWILKYITTDIKPRIETTATIDTNGIRKEVSPAPSYKTYLFSDLQPKSGFSKDTFKYAIDLLYKNEHIVPIYMDGKDNNLIEMKGNEEGSTALHDRVYENEIVNYNNERLFAFSRWILPIIAIVLSIISISIATCHKPTQTILPLIRIDTIKQVTTLPVSSSQSKNLDSQAKKEMGLHDTLATGF